VYAELHETGSSIELTNNHYISGLRKNNMKPGMIRGTDVDK
jgi:hypothetical protein